VSWSSVIGREEIYSYLREMMLSVLRYELNFTHYCSEAKKENVNMLFSLESVAVVQYK
jgi:hypothetical protein